VAKRFFKGCLDCSYAVFSGRDLETFYCRINGEKICNLSEGISQYEKYYNGFLSSCPMKNKSIVYKWSNK